GIGNGGGGILKKLTTDHRPEARNITIRLSCEARICWERGLPMEQMMALQRKTVKVGDVFQILTSEGVCYGQVTHIHPKWKFVIAIFREFYASEPEDFTAVVASEPQIITTFLAQDAIEQGLFSLIANVAVSEHLKSFPT